MADGTGFGRIAAPGRASAPTRMALDLTAETITLLSRTGGDDWTPVSIAAIAAEDFGRSIDWLRSETLVRGGRGCTVTLFLPPEQILHRRAALPAAGAARLRAALAVLEATSVYRAADLAVAIAPAGLDGQSVILATLAQTWREARDYATRWGFAVEHVSTRAQADDFGLQGPVFALAGDAALRAAVRPWALRGLAAGLTAVVALGLWSGLGAPDGLRGLIGGPASLGTATACCGAPVPDWAEVQPTPALPGDIAPSPVRLADLGAAGDVLPVSPGPVLPQRPLLPGAPLRLDDTPPADPAPTQAARYARQPGVESASGEVVLLALAGSTPPAPGAATPDRPLSDASPEPADYAATDDLRLAAGAPARAPTPPATRGPGPGGSTPVLPDADTGTASRQAVARAPLPPRRPRVDLTVTLAPELLTPPPQAPAGETPAVAAPAVTAEPAPAVPEAEPEAPASRYARAVAPIPPSRPLTLHPTLPLPNTGAARTPTRLPSPGRTPIGVQQLATEQGLPTKSAALVGILNLQGGRQALLRLPDGRFERVGTGDVLDGWRVSLIGRDALRLTKGGEDRTLLLVDR